jgi:S1-C subfamily serine protease
MTLEIHYNPGMNETSLTALSSALADAVASVQTSIVTVHAPRAVISGLVYAPDLVLTVAHVLERSEKVHVETSDGRKLEATIIGHDPQTDLALLRVPDLKLEAVKIFSEAARVGELVLMVAITSSGVMASHGIVSASHGLRFGRGSMLEAVVRTDAMPFPGCSGGAIVNASGEVLGVTNAGIMRGVGLGIPAQLAWTAAQNILSGKVSKRGYLGVAGQPVRLSKKISDQEIGLLVIRVETDSPAEHAGILVGDILLALNDHKLEDAGDLLEGLAGVGVGDAVSASLIRGGKLEAIKVTVGERPQRQNEHGEHGEGRGRWGHGGRGRGGR